MLIELEGCDGVGKTTVAKLLAAKLGAGYLKFPDRSTPTGAVIDRMLRGELTPEPVVFQALCVVNIFEHMADIEAALRSCRYHVVCDRWVQSAFVYGASDGLSEDWLYEVMRPVPDADLHVLLYMEPARIEGERLAGRDREIYERRGLQGVQDQQERFADRWAAHYPSPYWLSIDTGKNDEGVVVDKIFTRIQAWLAA